MNAIEFLLPPTKVYGRSSSRSSKRELVTEAEEGNPSFRGYLEIEVSRINFITEKSTTAPKSALYKNRGKSNKIQLLSRKNLLASGINTKLIWWGEQRDTAGSVNISCVREKIHKASKSTASQAAPTTATEGNKARNKSRHYRPRSNCSRRVQQIGNQAQLQKQRQRQRQRQQQQQQQKRQKQQQQQQQQQQQYQNQNQRSQVQSKSKSKYKLVLLCHNKFRYCVHSSLTLFLDYLRECPPIEVVATTGASVSVSNNSRNAASYKSNSHRRQQQHQHQHQQQQANFPTEDQQLLGQAYIPLPAVLLQKYASNYVNGCNFEYKTKIYALRRKIACGTPSSQVQQQQQLKTGEIQLRFRMLFAAPNSATPAATANTKATGPKNGATSASAALKLPCAILQNKLTTLSTAAAAMHTKKMLQQQPQQAEENKGEKPTPTTTPTTKKSVEIMEAMKKLDADLIALLTRGDVVDADDDMDGSIVDVSPKPKLNLKCLDVHNSPLKHLIATTDDYSDNESNNNNNDNSNNDNDTSDEEYQEQLDQLELFRSVSGVKLHMEAVALQSEGTKRMELLQSEIRPIFTVECQLSNDLIKAVPRHELYHVMQFESEKFQSLTQCTRFGQEAQRAIRLQLNEPDADDGAYNFGRIHFTLWWREPGTCLNEMLGMGVLELRELYESALLEQCKCITINRRGVQLANVYLKISLLVPSHKMPKIKIAAGNVQLLQQLLDKSTAMTNGGPVNASDKNYRTAANDGGTPAAGVVGSEDQCNNNNQNPNSGSDQPIAGNPGCSGNNNAPVAVTTQFQAETSKVRLLRGFISVSETRKLQVATNIRCSLVCQPFWQEQQITIAAGEHNIFDFQEQFSIIKDEKFLKSVEKQHMILEIQPVGIVRLPLHQFFIAYRDATITNHLCKAKLPVISIDCWAPIVTPGSDVVQGELKCLLAIGASELQIKYLRETRDFITRKPTVAAAAATSPVEAVFDNRSTRSTSVLMDMLQNALGTSPSAQQPATSNASGVVAAPLKPILSNKLQTFKFTLNIVGAAGLPLNPGIKGKKSNKRNAAAATATATTSTGGGGNKRFTPNEPPSSYVTFQADDCNCKSFKSHEGTVYATKIVEKSTEPQWQIKFRVNASVEYLTNPQKRFILKIWKKAATDVAHNRNQPAPLEDVIIGFAALNLNLTPSGLLSGGWFNIVDFNGRINGGLEVYFHPLEDLHKLLQPTASVNSAAAGSRNALTSNMDTVIDQFEQSLDLTHLNLGQAIKRKFNELEQISHRLRTRLVDVTGEELAPHFDANILDNWQATGGGNDDNDHDDDEFERDLQTPPPVSPTTSTTPPTAQMLLLDNSEANATATAATEMISALNTAVVRRNGGTSAQATLASDIAAQADDSPKE